MLKNCILQSNGLFLDRLNEFQRKFSSELEDLRKYHQLLQGETLTLIDTWQQDLTQESQKRMDQLKLDHEKEINDQHTVALKMSLFRDYDKKIMELQRELDYTKKQLERVGKGAVNLKIPSDPVDQIQFAQKKTSSPTPDVVNQKVVSTPQDTETTIDTRRTQSAVIQGSVASDMTVTSAVVQLSTVDLAAVTTAATVIQDDAQSLGEQPAISHADSGQEISNISKSDSLALKESPLKLTKCEDMISAPASKKTSDIVPMVESDVVTSSKSGTVSPVSEPVSVTVLAKRKIKWKDQTYYYDPKTLNVFISQDSNIVIGKKEEKRLTLF